MLFRKKSGSQPPSTPMAEKAQPETIKTEPAKAPAQQAAAKPEQAHSDPGPAANTGAPQAGAKPMPDPAKARALRVRTAALGEIISVYMRSQNHRGRTLSDLEQVLRPALASGQFTIARQTQDNLAVPIGVVIWASVSPDVDARLATDHDKPLSLKPEEWRSGDVVWVIDAAGDPRVIAAMLNDVSTSKVKRPIKIRTQGKDGKVTIRTLSPSAGATAAGSTPAV